MSAFWDRLFGKRPASAPTEPANDDVLTDVDEQIRRDVAAGFNEPEEIFESAMDVFADEVDPALLERRARQSLERELAAHSERQASWPVPTDCDRLEAAFNDLERKGIISRQNFSCCGSCGSLEIRDEIDAVTKAGGQARGYAFYHMQDTEAAADGYGLCLNYGACEEGEAAALAVGRDIVAELARHGLCPEWNGSWDKRIELPLDWKRRRSL